MKPFTNNKCSGESEGIGYIFNQNQDSCIILSNSTNPINSSLEINVFGEIGSFQIFSNSLNCKTNSNDPKPISFAFKNNQCANLPTMFNYNFNTTTTTTTETINSFNTDNIDLYFQMNLISSQNEINQIIDQIYGVKKFQYQSSNQCSNSNFQLIQFFTNNFNITTINNNNNNTITSTILCNSQKEPTIQQCINGGSSSSNSDQCIFESLYLSCSEIIENDYSYNIVQTC
ncbi:hypothetical protein ACTFIU_007601 [Dictyostelium citrinum]